MNQQFLLCYTQILVRSGIVPGVTFRQLRIFLEECFPCGVIRNKDGLRTGLAQLFRERTRVGRIHILVGKQSQIHGEVAGLFEAFIDARVQPVGLFVVQQELVLTSMYEAASGQ